MDLKALIAKMDHIESKQLLNEGFPTVADAKDRADKEKTTGKFDKKEIKPGVTQYTRKSSTFDDGGKDSDQKKAEKKKKNEDVEFQGSIAQALLREFGLDELDEKITLPGAAPTSADPTDPTNPANAVNAAKPAAAPAGGSTPNPYPPGSPNAKKFDTLTEPDKAWVAKPVPDEKGGMRPGQPDIANDNIILQRAPNKGKPAAPAAAAPAAAAPATGVQAQGDDEGNTMITRPDGSTMVVGPDGNAIPPGGGKQQPAAPAAPATAQPPAGGAGGPDAVAATRKRMQELLDKLEKTGGVSGSAPAPAAGGAKPPVGGKPAAPGFANTGGGAATGNPNIAKQGAAAGAVRENSEDEYILSLIRAK